MTDPTTGETVRTWTGARLVFGRRRQTHAETCRPAGRVGKRGSRACPFSLPRRSGGLDGKEKKRV